MTTYLNRHLETPTPQSEPLPGQTKNSAGGYSYPVDDETRIRRFLILGSEGGTYYAAESILTWENAESVVRMAREDTKRALDLISEISRSGRAARNSPALFALALTLAHGEKSVRRQVRERLPEVARTGSHLLEFASYAAGMRGWGRALRKAVAAWYENRPLEDLVYQTVKYRERSGYRHKDLLRLSHPKADGARRRLFNWIAQGDPGTEHPELDLIRAYEAAKTADKKALIRLIREHKMSWEMVPAEALKEKEVWQALGGHMPLTALVRNLASLTRVGALAPMDAGWVVARLRTIGESPRSRIHPLNVLKALTTYRNGKGIRGKSEWTPVKPVCDALDAAFERSFDQAPQTGKRIYLGVDVSGSMDHGSVGGAPGLTPRMAAAAMAMAVARREPNHVIRAFTCKNYDPGHFMSRWDGSMMVDLDLAAGDSLTDAMAKTDKIPLGGTDCALPMLDALETGLPVDCFVILTDSETWAGKVHPAEALRRYRRETGIPAKLVVVGMTSNGFTIADPEDAGMLDVVGFDSAAPALIADFTGGGPDPAQAPDEEA